MKYLLILSLVLFSCTQQQDALFTNDSEISFDVTAGHFTNPVSASKIKGNAGILTYYNFSGIKSSGELATIIIITDSLKAMTYHQGPGTGSVFNLNNTVYSYVNAGEYLDVTITSYQNGVVNATFTGNISKEVSLNPLVLQPVTITGAIKNAKLSYY